MPLHRTIGISLALMMVSAGANAQTATKSTAHDPIHAAKPEEAHGRAARTRARLSAQRRLHGRRRAARYHMPPPHRPTLASFHVPGAARAGSRGEMGMAAWYDLKGRRTASGDRFEAARLTAAHRTLPLHSYAKVTDLENGRSVVVEINDRGPWRRGLTIDLSKGAAARLHMIGVGIARVAIEPLRDAPPAAPAPQFADYHPATALAVTPQLIAYHPDPPASSASTAKPASAPQPQQEACLQQDLQGSQ
jgi:rare lipoprotein A